MSLGWQGLNNISQPGAIVQNMVFPVICENKSDIVAVGSGLPLNCVRHPLQRSALKYDDTGRPRRVVAIGKRYRENVFGFPIARRGHIEFTLQPDGCAVIVGIR